MNKVYKIKQEVNDNGFVSGYYSFANVEDAINTMRSYVARQIRLARMDNERIDYLKVLADHVMDGTAKSQMICYGINGIHFDIRVWEEDLLTTMIINPVNF